MRIKLTSLYLTDYAEDNKKKRYFLDQLKNDILIEKFVSKDIEEKFKKIEPYKNDNRLHIGPAYIVGDKSKLVGFIRPAYFDCNVLYLHYGVVPCYRNQGYGSKILTETSNYVFKHIEDVEKIILDISLMNTYSIKAAKNAGFKYDASIYENDEMCDIKSYCKIR